jgi:hypothetical protein
MFVNLPVKDLHDTMEFFEKLGFTFNPQFTDENATAMIIGNNMYAMLLVEKFFQTFTKKEVIDAKKKTEAIISLSVENKEIVDQMLKKVIKAGGREYREPQDHGWMYERSFEDIDGHIWEIFYMNETAIPKGKK